MKHAPGGGAAQWIDRLDRRQRIRMDEAAIAGLERYVEWLRTEAVAAGALGPGEVDRLWPRHIADSLAYAAVFTGRCGDAVDIGSGAGLPGIPLALACPGFDMTLLDRSGRRCAMLRRVIRILEIQNVGVVEADVVDVGGRYDLVVARASLPPTEMFPQVKRLLAAGGEAVIGLSRHHPPDGERLVMEAAEHGLGADVVEIPTDVLDSPAWLLRMTHRDQHS